MDNGIPEALFEPGGILYERGLTPQVARGRFIRYSHEACHGHSGPWRDWPCVRTAFAVGERPFSALDNIDQEMIRKRIMQAPGIIMIRSRVSDDLPLVVPEMRPDHKVLTGNVTKPHRHTDATVTKSEAWRNHVAKPDPPAGLEDLRTLLPDWASKLFSSSGNPISGRHGGKNYSGKHAHRRLAKYLFSRQPKIKTTRSHAHADDFTGSAYGSDWGAEAAEREHLKSRDQADIKPMRPATQPDGSFPGGTFIRIREPEGVKLPRDPVKRRKAVEEYWHTVRHEHTFRRKDHDTALAARLSIHLMARKRLALIEGTGDGEVFIAAESCLKECAILAAIEGEDRRATVLSYPSVTLYPDELGGFAAKHLRGLRVYLVPDNDYAFKQQVRTQMFVARERLRKAVPDAVVHVAAPPLLRDDDGNASRDEKGEPVKLGADDALGPLRGYTLDDFVILDRPVPGAEEYVRWKRGRTPRHGRSDEGDAHQAAVFAWLALLADDTGETTLTDRSIARYALPEEWGEAEEADLAAGRDPDTGRPHDEHRDSLRRKVTRWIGTMRDLGAITVTGEDVVLDDDGEPVRANGVPLKVKTRRIKTELWEMVRGERYTIGSVREAAAS